MEKLIEQFAVHDDDGNPGTLYVYQEIIAAGHFGDPHATINGLKRIENGDGDPVNYIDENTFKDVFSGRKLTRSA